MKLYSFALIIRLFPSFVFGCLSQNPYFCIDYINKEIGIRMKKAFLFVLFLFSVILTASAQHKVSVKLLDGTVHKYYTTDIEEILFDEDNQDESDGPKVPYTHAIDLGLSVKWADMNVGAEKPEDYGGYYAWAGLKETEVYDWRASRYSRNDGTTMLKYCANRDQGTCD